jgi:hypothetical protein
VLEEQRKLKDQQRTQRAEEVLAERTTEQSIREARAKELAERKAKELKAAQAMLEQSRHAKEAK